MSDSECSYWNQGKPNRRSRHCPGTTQCCYFRGGSINQRVCSTQYFGGQGSYNIHGFTLGAGCAKVLVYDNDEEEEEEELLQELEGTGTAAKKSAQNVYYYSSQSSLPYDLNNDVRGFQVWPKQNC